MAVFFKRRPLRVTRPPFGGSGDGTLLFYPGTTSRTARPDGEIRIESLRRQGQPGPAN